MIPYIYAIDSWFFKKISGGHENNKRARALIQRNKVIYACKNILWIV